MSSSPVELNPCPKLRVRQNSFPFFFRITHSSIDDAIDVLSGVPSRFGNKYGVDLKMEDSLAAALTDRVPNPTPMGITAENLAKMYNITREDCDAYAVQSQQRWKAGQCRVPILHSFFPAFSLSCFVSNLVRLRTASDERYAMQDSTQEPLPTKLLPSLSNPEKATSSSPKTSIPDPPRPLNHSANSLPSFRKEVSSPPPRPGWSIRSHLPGESDSDGGELFDSGICDGASANIVASDVAIKRFGLKPLAKVLAYHVVAVEPSIMGQ